MAWRFRRSFRIAPGVRWNISRRGSSWSFGPRGFKLNVSSRGVRRTISLLGTGLSHSQMISSGGARPKSSVTSDGSTPSSPPPASPAPTFKVRADPATIVPLTDDAAISVARRWAIYVAPFIGRLMRSAITAVERSPVESVQAVYTVCSRRVVVKTEPLLRKVKPTGTLPDPAGFDPWSPTIQTELQPSRAIVQCPGCAGEGRLTCPQCSGTVDLECNACGGTGSVISERSWKHVSCRTCGGDGRRRCPCRDGVVTCEVCKGKGVATAWLDLEETTRDEKREDGTPQFLVNSAEPLIEANVEQVFKVVGKPDSFSDEARRLLQRPQLRFTPDAHDRVQQIAVEQKRSSVAVVRYELAGHQSEIAVWGWTGEVNPATEADRPFRVLRSRLLMAFLLALLANAGLLTLFVGRHWYYAEPQEAIPLAVLGLTLPLLLMIPIIATSLPYSRRSSGKQLAAALPVLLVVAGQAVLFASAGPTTERAEALFQQEQFENARKEAQAAVELGIDVERTRNIHDAVQLALLATNQNPSTVWQQVAKAQFFTAEGRQRAEARAVEYTASNARELQSKGNYSQSLALLAGVPLAYQQSDPIRERVLAAHAFNAASLWRTIQSKSPLPERLTACSNIQAPLKELQRGAALPVPRSEIEKVCRNIRELEAARVKREQQAAAAAQLRAQREAVAQQRREEAARRGWEMAPLRCRDGTLSPSCVCGGSRRGCCSHHGGVAGCSQ